MESLRGIFASDPDEGGWRFVSDRAGPSTRVSPDGRRLAYTSNQEKDKDGVWILDLVNGGEAKRIADPVGGVFWAPDGKSLIVSGDNIPGDRLQYQTWRVDVNGSNLARLPIAETDQVVDWSLDGKTLLVAKGEPNVNIVKRPVHLFDLSGKNLGRVVEGGGIRWRHRFDRVCKRVVYFQVMNEKDQDICELSIVNLNGKNPRRFLGERDDSAPLDAIWSPDGKRVAVNSFDRAKRENGRKNDVLTGCRVELLNADGKGEPIPVPLHPEVNYVQLIDWR